MDFVTPNYEGFLSLLQPKLSWVVRISNSMAMTAAVNPLRELPLEVLRMCLTRCVLSVLIELWCDCWRL